MNINKDSAGSSRTISLLIPNRNSAPWTESLCRSISSQLRHFHEIVVVEGESTDGSNLPLQSLVRAHPNGRVIERPAKGIYDAWNAGLAACTGDWILVLPSDDELHPKYSDGT